MAEIFNEYRVVFHYNRKVSGLLKPFIEAEYVRLRNIAIDIINPKLDEWNADFPFATTVVKDDDPLKYAGGTDYCNYIFKKQAPIIADVNQKHARGLVKLYCDKDCEIKGVYRSKKHVTTVYITLEPVK